MTAHSATSLAMVDAMIEPAVEPCAAGAAVLLLVTAMFAPVVIGTPCPRPQPNDGHHGWRAASPRRHAPVLVRPPDQSGATPIWHGAMEKPRQTTNLELGLLLSPWLRFGMVS